MPTALAILLLLLVVAAVASSSLRHERTVGYGQVRFDGHGPEWWAAKWRSEHRARLAAEARARRMSHTLSVRWHPTVSYAIRLASAVVGVPQGELWGVSRCETGGTFSPFARNGRYRGIFQEGPMFEDGPLGRAGFSVWDPIANALTAALVVRRDGSWRQWTCGYAAR